MAGHERLRLHVAEATGLPEGHSIFGGGVYLVVKVDGEKVCQSATVDPRPTARFDLRLEHILPPTAVHLDLEVRKYQLVGKGPVIGGCKHVVRNLAGDNLVLPLYAMDGSGRHVGALQVSVHVEGGGGMYAPMAGALHSQPGGLPNRAIGSFDEGHHHHHLAHAGSMQGGLVNHAATEHHMVHPGSMGGGLMNHAASVGPPMSALASVQGGLPNHSVSGWGEAHRSMTGGLVNHSARGRDAAQEPVPNQSVGGLLNLASAGGAHAHGTDGVVALEDVQVLLRELEGNFEPQNAEDLQKLQQALEYLRRVSKPELKSKEGLRAIQACTSHIQAVFDHAMATGDARGRERALWLAGRLPHDEEDDDEVHRASLQDILRRRWDQAKMREAFDSATAAAPSAASSDDGLDRFMDSLDLAEFHAQQAGEDPRPHADALLAQVGPALRQRLLGLLRDQRLDELEYALGLLGNARVYALALQGVQQDLQRRRGVELLRNALLPIHSQIGFPELKRRQLRHAVMTAQATLADDPSGQVAASLKRLMLEELLPQCLAHSDESTEFGVRTCFDLKVGSEEDLCTQLPEICKARGREPPPCLVEKLRAVYRLPMGWDVGAMAKAEKRLLAKTPVTDLRMLRVFNDLLVQTAQPSIRTRDRRGALPQRFSAVRAVEVMNAANWTKYVRRRDEIASECRTLKARHDDSHWQDNLNGLVMSMCIKDAMSGASEPLLAEANEMWLIHGTNHVAAEGITSEDFDMTRASPSGLFGAGVYFAESISKSDEYVQGKVEGGQELFPLLLCRVCLGYVYYCDELTPDKGKLVDRCIKEDWHSVLGDRKKTRGTFREFIVYDNLQAFPAYIIYYARHY